MAVLMVIFRYLGNKVTPANSTTEQNQIIEPTTSLYSNPDFGVSFTYPSSWQPVAGKKKFNNTPLYYGGDDGFFGIDAIGVNSSTKVSIDDIVRQLISDPSNPYGTSPSVTTPNTGKIEARLVAPSDNQPAEKKGEAVLIIQYPKPIIIGKSTVQFFMLYGDRAHLGEIAGTLEIAVK